MAVNEHTRAVRWVSFSPDGSCLATCGEDSLLLVLRIAIMQVSLWVLGRV
jgi:WD40 repeat protein